MEARITNRRFIRPVSIASLHPERIDEAAPAISPERAAAAAVKAEVEALEARVGELDALIARLQARVDQQSAGLKGDELADDLRIMVPPIADARIQPVVEHIGAFDSRLRRLEIRLDKLHDEVGRSMAALEVRFSALHQEVNVILGLVVLTAFIFILLVISRV